MKVRQLAMASAGAAPLLLLTDLAPAEYVGIVFDSVSNPFGLATFRLYAVFDRPGDEMLAVHGSPEVPLELTVPGCFYEHAFGSDTAPLDGLIAAFPSLAFDTYVTIGVKSVGTPGGQPVDETTLLPGWPGLAPCPVMTTTSGWAVSPGAPQGDPFDPVNSFPGNAHILLAQFSGELTSEGTLTLQYRTNGVIEERVVSFIAGLVRCDDTSDCINHPCFWSQFCDGPGNFCESTGAEITDCNGNRVHDTCDIDWELSRDVNGNGIPDDCECLADCGNGDGVVGIDDFLALIGVWGQTGVACDLDGGSVGITDFLLLLSLWGPCP